MYTRAKIRHRCNKHAPQSAYVHISKANLCSQRGWNSLGWKIYFGCEISESQHVRYLHTVWNTNCVQTFIQYTEIIYLWVVPIRWRTYWAPSAEEVYCSWSAMVRVEAGRGIDAASALHSPTAFPCCNAKLVRNYRNICIITGNKCSVCDDTTGKLIRITNKDRRGE